MDSRRIAFEVLLKIKRDAAYSNQALKEAFLAYTISPKDKALITEIVYGTLTHYKLLIFYLQPYFQGRVKEWVQVLLAMSLYQKIYLEKVPLYAIIDDAVEIAKKRGGNFNGAAVNAILRKVADGSLRNVEEINDPVLRLATEFSHPAWMINLWNAQFGVEKTLGMLRENNERARMVLRTNLSLVSTDELVARLELEGVTCEPGVLCATAVIVLAGNPLATDAFCDGLFYVQDEASMLPARALAPSIGARVLDVCAAPGGKSFHLGEMVGVSGVVQAHDIFDHKIALVKENAQRLKVNNVEISVCSALDLDRIYEPESFDYILVDAPCSGLGILRRHPEAKLMKQPEDLDEIVEIQRAILTNSAKFLKAGGRLVYSTCTVNRKENHRQIEAFLQNFADFELDTQFEQRMPAILKDNFENGMLQLFPQDFKTDGFFVASLIKK